MSETLDKTLCCTRLLHLRVKERDPSQLRAQQEHLCDVYIGIKDEWPSVHKISTLCPVSRPELWLRLGQLTEERVCPQKAEPCRTTARMRPQLLFSSCLKEVFLGLWPSSARIKGMCHHTQLSVGLISLT